MNDTLEFTIPDGYELDKEKSNDGKLVCRKKEKYVPKEGDLVVLENDKNDWLYNKQICIFNKGYPSIRSKDGGKEWIFHDSAFFYAHVRPATPEETEIFTRIMADNGYEYDPVKKEVRKKRWRGKLYEQYWFVDENSKTGYCIEFGDSIDNERYKSGNYFRTEEEAAKVAAKFNEILNERM